MTINFTNTVQSVTEITRSIKGILEHGFAFVAVNGEISNLRRPYSGHLYFTLKDDNAQLKAVLFKSQSRYLEKELRDGAQVICRGRVSVYEARGDYQIIVDSVDFAGAGAKHLAFEKLKRRLEAEGLFAADHKLPLPFLPHKIALITSPQGAAVHDFLKIASRRFPAVPIEIYPAPMQGEQAAAAIIQALELIQKRDCDVIVICRGGGSLEDLWPFNNEELARKIYNCSLPVVSAIGHEVDFTILDLVADERSPTPTAAAEAVLPDCRVLSQTVSQNRNHLIEAMNRRLTALRQRDRGPMPSPRGSGSRPAGHSSALRTNREQSPAGDGQHTPCRQPGGGQSGQRPALSQPQGLNQTPPRADKDPKRYSASSDTGYPGT